jgi:hypothetical protein
MPASICAFKGTDVNVRCRNGWMDLDFKACFRGMQPDTTGKIVRCQAGIRCELHEYFQMLPVLRIGSHSLGFSPRSSNVGSEPQICSSINSLPRNPSRIRVSHPTPGSVVEGFNPDKLMLTNKKTVVSSRPNPPNLETKGVLGRFQH